ncbi:MAG: methyltransferase [Flavobacteriaceae bacterium]|nr:methyltransferase [Flavobacteriaceae bacterium]
MSKSTNPFRLKEFTVEQSRSAMKVGTDAMILGSWTQVEEAETILDIGTGTGILALMLAQRSEAFTIDAVEIDADAYEEAVTNFENSPWGDRLFCYHASLQAFAQEIDDTYDLIVCNPPYFSPSEIESYTGRNVARQTHLLNHLTLIKNTVQLLSESGSCAFSLPYESEAFFIELAQSQNLFLQRRLRMKDRENLDIVRSFLQFGKTAKPLEDEILILKNSDLTYTNQFIELTIDFYTIF